MIYELISEVKPMGPAIQIAATIFSVTLCRLIKDLFQNSLTKRSFHLY